MDTKVSQSADVAGKTILFESGELAPRASAAILATCGETVVLATVTVSKEDSDRDYFPLSVEFIEKYYAGGIISSSRFVKRERFPSEEAILNARMIDRSIRPLFPQNFRRDVQVVVTVLSYDEENDPAMLGLNAASAAVMNSEVPFAGPVAGLRIGRKNGEFLVNPSNGDLAESEMDFIISGTEDAIVMLDAGGNEVAEDIVAEAFDFAMENFKALHKAQHEYREKAGREKLEVTEEEGSDELKNALIDEYDDKIDDIIYELKGNIPGERRSVATSEIVTEFAEKHEGTYSKSDISNTLDKIMKMRMRKGILERDERPSGRKMDEIRQITMKLGLLPRTHGSAFFARGVTQSLSIVTLGSTRLEQTLESYEGEETKRFMHHYNGPSFSLGEAGRYSYYPGRREIGHGALAEKALQPVIPAEDKFPYTIRVVSEILAQQGSSSMAATCGTTLALMDAGVPIKAPVAGIAIGLVTSDDMKEYKLLTDVQDLEDFYGDMDFKVTGTKNGITAIQMDNKLHGIPVTILKQALEQAKTARTELLDLIHKLIEEPRQKLSEYAPKITTLKINPEKIADLIGPGGKVIKGILEETGAEIDINDDGSVYIAAVSDDARQKAIEMINAIVEEPEVGKVYEGVVDKVMPYGAFVDVSPAISGLVHISELSDSYVKDPSEVVKEGQNVKVKVIGIDEEGRTNFSMKRINEDGSQEQKTEK